MPDVEIADDRQRRVVDDLDQKLLVHVLAFAVHRLANQHAIDGAEHSGVFEMRQSRAVFFWRHPLLAGFQQQNFALPVLSRGEKVVFSAELRHICISRTIKEIVECVNAAAENFPREYRAALQKPETIVGVRGGGNADL